MTDQKLSQMLTGALDARIAQAESAPVTQVSINRLPMPDMLSATVVKAIPARKLRWKTAVAAVLAICLLGGVGLLLSHLQNRANPVDPIALQSANCHQVSFQDGESAFVMDRAYEGEYDLQHITVTTVDAPEYPAWVGKIEDGFLQQTVMSYDDYAAYCAQFGLTQTYTDRDSHYLLVSNASGHALKAEALPIDLAISGNQAALWLWDEINGMANDTAGYVLTIPVSAEVESLELHAVLKPEEASVQALYHSTAITEQADGTYCIEGWCVGPFPKLVYYGKERIGLKIDADTEIDDASMQIISQTTADSFGLKFRAEGCVPYTLDKTNREAMAEEIHAENPDAIVDLSSPYDGMDRVFTVAKLTILSDESHLPDAVTHTTEPTVSEDPPQVE